MAAGLAMTAPGIMILPSSPVIRRAADRDPAGGEIPVKRWSQPLSKEVARCAWGSSVEYKCRNNQKRNLDNRCHGDRSCGGTGGRGPCVCVIKIVVFLRGADWMIVFTVRIWYNIKKERDTVETDRSYHCAG